MRELAFHLSEIQYDLDRKPNPQWVVCLSPNLKCVLCIVVSFKLARAWKRSSLFYYEPPDQELRLRLASYTSASEAPDRAPLSVIELYCGDIYKDKVVKEDPLQYLYIGHMFIHKKKTVLYTLPQVIEARFPPIQNALEPRGVDYYLDNVRSNAEERVLFGMQGSRVL